MLSPRFCPDFAGGPLYAYLVIMTKSKADRKVFRAAHVITGVTSVT